MSTDDADISALRGQAICEAAQRPTMQFVQPKSAEQQTLGTAWERAYATHAREISDA